MKVMSIIGTRPDLIKMSEVIKKLDKHTEHVLVHSGQNYDYELNEIFYEDLELRRPDEYLGSGGGTLAETISNIFINIEIVLNRHKPDAVVILGDTNSALASVIVKRMKIPLFHLEAGNRCFDDIVPEEVNRRLIDHISDVNLVYTENQRLYLLNEGVAKDRIFVTGSPMKEILIKHYIKIINRDILLDLDLRKNEYFLVSLHRAENLEVEENYKELMKTLDAISYNYGLPIIVSRHPHLKNSMSDKLVEDKLSMIRFVTPFGFLDYNKLQMNARCVISDSGTISEESAILGFPAITVRNAIERPEAIDAGSIIMAGVNKENILKSLEVVAKPTTIPLDYATNDFSDRVLKVILGYTNYVNRYVYHR